jgi:hypothetical protein
MLSLPKEAQFLEQFRAVFGEPTFRRVLLLCVGAIVADGRRTVSRLLWVVRALTAGHSSSYHRVFSRSKWSALAGARVLAGLVVAAAGEGPLRLAVDDTTEQRRGDRVYGKGTHRDAVRSSRSHVVHLFGLKWVILAVLVNFPFSTRPWALPVLVALYRPKQLDAQERRRHKTPTQLARGLLALMLRWFPDRRFILLGDGGYAGCELACFCNRRRGRLTLVSRFHPDAVLHQPPPPPTGKRGRPAKKGAKLPTPQQTVESSKPLEASVDWYGGRKRDVQLTAGNGLWYSHRGGRLVPVRWVHVADAKNPSRREEYFYSTDTAMAPAELVGHYTGRWPIEVTIEEAKQRLGLGSTRQYKQSSVLRATPCILALYSLVSLAFAARCKTHPSQLSPRPGSYHKQTVSFSDALACVRRLLWAETILEHLPGARLIRKLPRTFAKTVLDLVADVA